MSDEVRTIALTAAVSGVVGALSGLLTQWITLWLSGRVWFAQEQWKMRRETYSELFKVLAELRGVVLRGVRFDRLVQEHNGVLPPEEREERRNLNALLYSANQRLAALKPLALVILDRKAYDALEAMEAAMGEGDPNDLTTLFKPIADASKALVSAASHDFKLDVLGKKAGRAGLS